MAADFFIGESLVGDGNEVAHIDLIIGSKSGPAGQAFVNALANQREGHSTLLAVVSPNLPAKPDALLFNKVTIKGATQAVQMFGPAQAAVARAVGGRWRCRPSTVFSLSETLEPEPDAQASAAARQLTAAERVRPGGSVRRRRRRSHELRRHRRSRRPRLDPWLHLHAWPERPKAHRRLHRLGRHDGGRATRRRTAKRIS